MCVCNACTIEGGHSGHTIKTLRNTMKDLKVRLIVIQPGHVWNKNPVFYTRVFILYVCANYITHISYFICLVSILIFVRGEEEVWFLYHILIVII